MAALGALLLAGLAAAAPAATERRVALVVGNAAYADMPLANSANDARAVASALREAGFEVMLHQNADKRAMERAISDFGEKLGPETVGLFYFAGHGVQVGGRNFLVPIGARISSEQRVRLESVDVDIVLEQMAAAGARVSIAVLDACRNNPFERRFRSVAGGLAQMNAPEGTLIAYATAPGKVAADGDGANGVYTAELVRALRAPGLSVEDVFKQVRVAVARRTSGEQVPWEASSLVGDFYFRPPAPGAAAVAASTPTREAEELAAWERIKDGNDVAAFESHVDAWPDGAFAPLARARIAALRSPAVTQPPAVRGDLATSARPYRGRYGAVLKDVSPRLGDLALTLEVGDREIYGRANASRDPSAICRIGGAIQPTGTIQRTELACGDELRLGLHGFFTHDIDKGQIGDVTGKLRYIGPNSQWGDFVVTRMK